MRALRCVAPLVTLIGCMSCDTATEPVVPLRQESTLTFLGNLNASSNLTEFFREPRDSRTPKYIVVAPSSLAHEVNLNGDIGIVCDEEDTGTLWVFFQLDDSPNISSYHLDCRSRNGAGGGSAEGVGPLRQESTGTFQGNVNVPFNLTAAFKLPKDPRTPKYIVVAPSSLAHEVNLNGDVGFECDEVGTGTLWVYFQLDDSPNTSYYDLTCRPHDQGSAG